MVKQKEILPLEDQKKKPKPQTQSNDQVRTYFALETSLNRSPAQRARDDTAGKTVPSAQFPFQESYAHSEHNFSKKLASAGPHVYFKAAPFAESTH